MDMEVETWTWKLRHGHGDMKLKFGGILTFYGDHWSIIKLW